MHEVTHSICFAAYSRPSGVGSSSALPPQHPVSDEPTNSVVITLSLTSQQPVLADSHVMLPLLHLLTSQQPVLADQHNVVTTSSPYITTASLG